MAPLHASLYPLIPSIHPSPNNITRFTHYIQRLPAITRATMYPVRLTVVIKLTIEDPSFPRTKSLQWSNERLKGDIPWSLQRKNRIKAAGAFKNSRPRITASKEKERTLIHCPIYPVQWSCSIVCYIGIFRHLLETLNDYPSRWWVITGSMGKQYQPFK